MLSCVSNKSVGDVLNSAGRLLWQVLLPRSGLKTNILL